MAGNEMEYKVSLHFVIYVTEKRAYKFHSFAYIRKFIYVSRYNNLPKGC